MSAPATVANEKPSRRVTLSRRASFWAAAAFAFLAFAASTAASPLYRVYEDKFSFAPTNAHLVVHGLHRRPAGHAAVVRLGV